MIYLASPYSHPEPSVRHYRYIETMKATVHFMQLGHIIFSPIVYGHGMAEVHNLPTNHEHWQQFNEEMLLRCDALWVLKLAGWELSTGIQHELAFADANGIDIRFKELLS